MESVFFIKIYVQVLTTLFYIQICFKCGTPLLFFSNKNHDIQKKNYRKKLFIEKNVFLL